MKITHKVVFSIVSIILLFSLAFNVVAFASESFLYDSFDKLSITGSNGAYVPPNPMGNCYYTAISMLLTYYDSYWHKDFVAENLEWAPGLYNSASGELVKTFSAWEEYNEYMNVYRYDPTIEEKSPRDFYLTYSDYYLQSHLISRGIAQGYHPYDTSKSYDSTENNIFSFTANNCKNYLTSYLSYRGFNAYGKPQVTVNIQSGNIEALLPEIKEHVENGYPVLYIGWREEQVTKINDAGVIVETTKRVGHVMVAYGIDTDGDVLLHCGWNIENTFDQVEETRYPLTPYIVWLEIDENLLPHECDYNYVDSLNPDITYCSCQIYSDTHNAHKEENLVTKSSSTTHWQGCTCGYKIDEESHSFSHLSNDDASHLNVCSECNYSILESHTASTIVGVSEDHHEVRCSCGYVIETEEHSRSYCEYNSLASHNIYCECGQYLGREVHTPVNKLGKTYCSGCLYIIDDDDMGLVNGSKDDPEALLE